MAESRLIGKYPVIGDKEGTDYRACKNYGPMYRR